MTNTPEQQPGNPNKNLLNRWLWKWHILAGLICLPFMLLLAFTGILYLFKGVYNDMRYFDIQNVQHQSMLEQSFSTQLKSAQSLSDKAIVALVVPQVLSESEFKAATEFHQETKGHTKDRVFVNPYDATVTGTLFQKDTFMYTVRKLHGELLLGKPGSWWIELVASWFLILILSGLYVWWPGKKKGFGGVFKIRRNSGDQAFRRDMHVVLSFWLSVFLLIILAGGMPWTDVFGGNLKWVQKQTNTGYPVTWNAPKGMSSTLPENTSESTLSLDQIITQAKQLNLSGKLTIGIPQKPNGVYKLSNRSFWLSDQQVIYLDQYTGQIIKKHTWSDVGILMNLRQVFMRLHQGEYGWVNWLLLLLVAQVFILSTCSALISYLRRKKPGSWSLPQIPANFVVGKSVIVLMVLLALVFPMFGISLLGLLFIQWLLSLRQTS